MENIWRKYKFCSITFVKENLGESQRIIKEAQTTCNNLKLWKQQCKARSHLVPIRQKGLIYICSDCVPHTDKSKVLQSAKSMKSHYKNVHNFSEEKATKRIMEYEEKEVILELERRRRDYQKILKTGINPFQFSEEIKTIIEHAIALLDTETTSLYDYPNGVFCSVSVNHQFDTKIITSLANPAHNIAAVISPGKGREKTWPAESILIHKILP